MKALLATLALASVSCIAPPPQETFQNAEFQWSSLAGNVRLYIVKLPSGKCILVGDRYGGVAFHDTECP